MSRRCRARGGSGCAFAIHSSAGEQASPLARLAATADFGNGIVPSLPFDRFLFINADLHVHLHRQPQGEWIGIDARTLLHPGGTGLAESVLHDLDGPVGRAFQALVVSAADSQRDRGRSPQRLSAGRRRREPRRCRRGLFVELEARGRGVRRTCSGRLAPTIAEATLGWRRTQARASWGIVIPACPATSRSRSTAWRIGSLISRPMKPPMLSLAARESAGGD